MAQAIAIGGVFLRARDPNALHAWYEKHLGLKGKAGEGVMLQWGGPDSEPGMTVFSLFERGTAYFGSADQPVMLNFIVDDLDALLAKLKDEEVWIDPKREDHEYGRFAWIRDGEGNRVELWQAPKSE
jgi:predicted enzyme related to lactoylglutathione lyase